jgi:hypothetical protein
MLGSLLGNRAPVGLVRTLFRGVGPSSVQFDTIRLGAKIRLIPTRTAGMNGWGRRLYGRHGPPAARGSASLAQDRAGIRLTQFARQCSVMVRLLLSPTFSVAVPPIGMVASG